MLYDPYARGLGDAELFRAPRLDELHSRLLYLVEHRVGSTASSLPSGAVFESLCDAGSSTPVGDNP